jgi:hypothetical protein
MIPLSRVPALLRAGCVGAVVGLALTSCGGTPEKTALAPKAPRASTSSTSSPSTPPSTKRGRTQVVKVKKYGISFELPKGWITLNAKKVLTRDNPGLKSLAKRMGTTTDQLNRTLAAGMEVYAVTDKGAVGGYLDNVNVTGQRGTELNDDQIKLQFAAIGAKLGTFQHTTTPAGDITRVSFTLPIAGRTAYGVSVIVFTDDSTVNITAGGHSADVADNLANRIEGSLTTIPGNGPDL